MRALSDFAGFSNLQLSDRFDVDMDMVNRVISGVTRSRLVAARKSRMRDVQRRAFLGQSAPSTHP